jgi:regulator of replication initiation timing
MALWSGMPSLPDGPTGENPATRDGSERVEDERVRERLEALSEVEAWKSRVAAAAEADPARLARGWQRRFVAEGSRADEMMALYRELGYEVCADPVDPKELDEGCRQCALVAAFRFRTIYTRRTREPD